jgi:hypothetical protein
LFEEINNKGGREQFALLHVGFDGFSQFSSLLLLKPEQLACRKMLKFVIPHERFCLGVFATAWSSQKKEDVRFREWCLGVNLNLHEWSIT